MSDAAQGTEDKEEQWKSDDFVSFNDELEDTSSDAAGADMDPTTAGASGTASTLNGESLPPWTNVSPVVSETSRVNPLVALHNEIVDFCTLISPFPEEIDMRSGLVEEFKRVAYDTFGMDKCSVDVFGSQATGLFLPTSDIDLVILFRKPNKDENVAGSYSNSDRKAQEQKEMDEFDAASSGSPLYKLADAIRDEWRDDLSYLEVIEKTRVPLVKFTHAPSGISFDICFDQETGPKAAALMKTYLDAMPPLRPLAFVLKYFMEARSLNEPYTGGVGSFMLQLMIVSFLQHRERVGYNFRRPSLYNLGCLLVEFLELYGLDFNYVTTGISVRHDGMYFSKGANDRREHYLIPNRSFFMAMENPLDPTMDVGTPSFRIQTVQRSFETAFRVLLSQLAEPMVPSVSVLASILPPTAEMRTRASSRQGRSRAASGNSDMATSSTSGSAEDKEPSNKRLKLLHV